MIPFLICTNCKNFLGNGKCKAFPDKIPIEIISGENEHKKPLTEQKNNIVFEAIKNLVK